MDSCNSPYGFVLKKELRSDFEKNMTEHVCQPGRYSCQSTGEVMGWYLYVGMWSVLAMAVFIAAICTTLPGTQRLDMFQRLHTTTGCNTHTRVVPNNMDLNAQHGSQCTTRISVHSTDLSAQHGFLCITWHWYTRRICVNNIDLSSHFGSQYTTQMFVYSMDILLMIWILSHNTDLRTELLYQYTTWIFVHNTDLNIQHRATYFSIWCIMQ